VLGLLEVLMFDSRVIADFFGLHLGGWMESLDFAGRIDGPEDIVTNEFVTGLAFEVTGEPTPGIDGFHRVEPGEGWLAMKFASR